MSSQADSARGCGLHWPWHSRRIFCCWTNPLPFWIFPDQVEILDLLTELNRKRRTTIIMVLHDINLSARYADYIFAMHNGKLTAQGSPNEVISPELMKEIYGLDCTIIQDPVSKTPLIIPKSRYHR